MNKKEVKEWNKYFKYSGLKEKNKEDLEFIKNASKEEKLAREIETLSHGNINSACLSICEIYGLSGLCGVECPNYNKCEYLESKGE